MNGLGSMTIDRPAGGEIAAATVNLYGPRGGWIGSTGIDARSAQDAVNRLIAFGAATVRSTMSESLSDITVRMRADADEIARRMESGELPDNFMDREAFACMDVGLKRFEYYAKVGAVKVTDE